MEDLNWKMLIAPLIILFVFIGGIIGIVNWQKSKQVPPVNMSVNLPEGDVQSGEKELLVSGTVTKGDKVFINDLEAKVEKDGSYSKTVTLNEGENKIVVKDMRDDKEISSVERTVKYTVQVPSASPEPTPEASPVSGTPATAPVPPAPSNLSTSGPEEVIIPIIGTGGMIFAIAFYFKSKKQLALNLRK